LYESGFSLHFFHFFQHAAAASRAKRDGLSQVGKNCDLPPPPQVGKNEEKMEN